MYLHSTWITNWKVMGNLCDYEGLHSLTDHYLGISQKTNFAKSLFRGCVCGAGGGGVFVLRVLAKPVIYIFCNVMSRCK